MPEFFTSWAFILLMLLALIVVVGVGIVLFVVFLVNQSKRNRDL